MSELPPYFFSLYERLPRQGPGSLACTRRALEATGLDPSRILDLGCGSGASSLDLARLTEARVTALDLHPGFVERRQASARQEGLSERIDARVGDMARLGERFEPASFDLIWAEGSLYFLGFSEGLRLVAPFLRPGGCLAVTEATWLVDEPPAECAAFWEAEYPAMTTRATNREAVEAAGLELLTDFPLPASAWLEGFYEPMEALITAERAREGLSPEDASVLDAMEGEAQLYRRFGESFGYVFYVARRPS